MSGDERTRRRRYLVEQDAQRFTIARGLLRCLLGSYLGVAARELRFTYGPYGKPLLDGPLQFNVSHSGDLVAVAVAWGMSVGVDIERVDGRVDRRKVTARFFPVEEHRYLQSLDGWERDWAFTRMWTQKEASLKATGIGMRGLTECGSSLVPSAGPTSQAAAAIKQPRGPVRLVELLGIRDYCAAVAMIPRDSAWR